MAKPIRSEIERALREDDLGTLPRAGLYALSVLYGIGVGARISLYRSGVLKIKKLPCKAVSIGNITVGGTGKTPVTIHVAGLLRNMGKRVAVLSRGYGRASKGVLVVSDGNAVLEGPDRAGDEPFLMARRLEGVPVVVGADRYRAGLLAFQKFRPDCVVLDDGFQHIRLHRDLNILLVDAGRAFGNGHLLPRGPLREGLRAVERADMVLVKRGGVKEAPGLLKDIGRTSIGFSYKPTALYGLDGKKAQDLSFLRGKKTAALAAVADPSSFTRTLEALGARVVKTIIFPDHHYYSKADIGAIRRGSEGAELVVTTEKDAVKLSSLSGDFRALVLRIEVEMEGPALEHALSRIFGEGR